MENTIRSATGITVLGTSLAISSIALAAPPSLANHQWVIIAIDGAPLESAPVDGVDRRPNLSFGQRSYSGNAGCNALGGLFVVRGDRLFTYPGPQTAMGCGGRRAAQEAALVAVLQASPVVSRIGDAIALSANGRRIDLRREPSARPVSDPPAAWQGNGVRGQTFDIVVMDGAFLRRSPLPRLTFAASAVSLTGICRSPVQGSYRQTTATITIVWRDRVCLNKPIPAGLLNMVSGPNGELLLADSRHWIAADNRRRNRPK